MSNVSIQVKGLAQLRQALRNAPDELNQTLAAAGEEAARNILETEGLRKYPPLGPANAPPLPYYVRGRGTQHATYNDLRSERLGTQYYVEARGPVTTIGNRASYADYVSGPGQARAMAAIGWRQLAEVAEEKLDDLTRIYEGWVARALKQAGL